jgi:hypothetical protein
MDLLQNKKRFSNRSRDLLNAEEAYSVDPWLYSTTDSTLTRAGTLPGHAGLRPPHRHRQPRHSRQLLGMRRSHIFQLPRQHRVDRRPLPPRQLTKHIPLIPRHPRPQLHQPDRLRHAASSPSASSITDCSHFCIATATNSSRVISSPVAVQTATIAPSSISRFSSLSVNPSRSAAVRRAKLGRGERKMWRMRERVDSSMKPRH